MPVASFDISGSPTTMCYSPTNNYTFNNTTSIANGSMSFAWNFGDTTTSSLYSPSHSYLHSGIQTWDTNAHRIYTKLVATSNQGCKDSITKYLILYPLPIANKLVISSYVGSASFPLYDGPTYFANASYPDDTIQCFNQRNWFGNAVNGSFTATNDMTTYNFGDGTSNTNYCCGISHGAPYKVYTAPGTYTVSAYITSFFGCVSQTVSNKIILTPNADSMPHSVIGLHPEITANTGVDPLFGHTSNHYKLFFAHLGSTACRPIVASYWRISYLSGNSYWNHGYFDYGPYSGILPLASDSAYFGFDADTNNTFQIRLITMNDLGMSDTAFATFGATNSGYTNYRAISPAAVPNNIRVYPNPAVSQVKIAIKLNKNSNTKLFVYNALGQEILTTKQYLFGDIVEEIKLNTQQLQTGTYYVQLRDEKNNILVNSKFVKMK
jgi:hypothetical protein